MATGNEEMWKRRNEYREWGLPCSRHMLSPGTVSDFYLSACRFVIQMTSSTFIHSIVQSMARSRARLGTNSCERVEG